MTATKDKQKSKSVSPTNLVNGGSFHQLYISEKFSAMYKHLCKVISDVEWCGMVFYETELVDKETGEMKYTPVYLHPMDKGSSTFTSHTFDASYAKLLFKKPELAAEGIYWGSLHSHNSMQTFFSGTDQDDLKENAGNYVSYLSMIVNNDDDMCVRIAQECAIESNKTVNYKNVDGKEYYLEEEKEEKAVIYFTPKVTKEVTPITFDELFLDQIKEICKPPVVTHTPTYNNTYGGGYGNRALGFSNNRKAPINYSVGYKRVGIDFTETLRAFILICRETNIIANKVSKDYYMMYNALEKQMISDTLVAKIDLALVHKIIIANPDLDTTTYEFVGNITTLFDDDTKFGTTYKKLADKFEQLTMDLYDSNVNPEYWYDDNNGDLPM